MKKLRSIKKIRANIKNNRSRLVRCLNNFQGVKPQNFKRNNFKDRFKKFKIFAITLEI